MSTIKKILRYNLSEEETIALELLEIINGCGGKGGFNISEFLDKIESLPYLDKDKFIQFKSDVRKLCNEHDIDFTRGGGLLRMIEVNAIFINSLKGLMHWVNENHLKYITRGLTIILFIGGFKYYKFRFRRLEFKELFLIK